MAGKKNPNLGDKLRQERGCEEHPSQFQKQNRR